jgi:hypothetical protein
MHGFHAVGGDDAVAQFHRTDADAVLHISSPLAIQRPHPRARRTWAQAIEPAQPSNV